MKSTNNINIFHLLAISVLIVVSILVFSFNNFFESDSNKSEAIPNLSIFDESIVATSIDWNNTDLSLVIGSNDNIYKYDFSSEKLTTLNWAGGGPVEDLAWSPDGNFISATNSPDVEVWDATTGKVIRHLESHIQYRIFNDIEWSPDSSMLAATSFGGPPRSITRIWSLDANEEIFTITPDMVDTSTSLEFGEGFSAISWSPDGEFLAIAMGWRNEIFLWNTSTWTISQILNQHSHPVTALTWITDELRLVSGDKNGSVIIWDIEEMTADGVFETFKEPIHSISWNAEWNGLAIAEMNNVMILNLQNGNTEIISLIGVNDVKWSNNGARLAIAHKDGVDLWLTTDTLLSK